jgi:ABC-2 type transport system ATP-binding protein
MTATLAPGGVSQAGAPGAPHARQAPAIDARGVERRHRGGRGVGPVDLCVEGGEVVVLMGPNGAGKTTLLRVLAGIDRMQRGEVRWFGGDVRSARRSIGLALDDAVEEATLSGLQSAYFWCRQWVGDAATARQLCSDALRRFGLWPVRDEPVGAYSFGMRRRLMLVEALAHRPRLALLDEPTAGLDPEGVQVLLEVLRERSADGLATVAASNDAAFAAAAARRVAFLSGGRLVRCAPPAELLGLVSAGRVAELVVAGSVDAAALRAIPGVARVVATTDGITVEFADGPALPRIVAIADAPAGNLVQLRLHEPDLRDAFAALTGEVLAATEDGGG